MLITTLTWPPPVCSAAALTVHCCTTWILVFFDWRFCRATFSVHNQQLIRLSLSAADLIFILIHTLPLRQCKVQQKDQKWWSRALMISSPISLLQLFQVRPLDFGAEGAHTPIIWSECVCDSVCWCRNIMFDCAVRTRVHQCCSILRSWSGRRRRRKTPSSKGVILIRTRALSVFIVFIVAWFPPISSFESALSKHLVVVLLLLISTAGYIALVFRLFK